MKQKTSYFYMVYDTMGKLHHQLVPKMPPGTDEALRSRTIVIAALGFASPASSPDHRFETADAPPSDLGVISRPMGGEM